MKRDRHTTSRRNRRPRTWRHFIPSEIGSEQWWRSARRLKVRRTKVESEFDLEARMAGGAEKINPHDFHPLFDQPAENAVSLFLLFSHVPSYATLMYVAHVWTCANRSLREWIVCQYATLVDGDKKQSDAALYSLWVDFFEVPKRAAFVFPRLLKSLPRRRWPDVLGSSGPVPWDVKHKVFVLAAKDSALHAGLARGLVGSFYDVYGSVNAIEARNLFRAITVDEEEVRTALEQVTTRPTRWQLVAVLKVDQSDERWTRWVPVDRRSEPSYLVLLRATDVFRACVRGSELMYQGRRIARLVHAGFPFDSSINHKVHGSLEHANPGTVLFRAEGIAASAVEIVGCEIEVWPPGLYVAPEDAKIPGHLSPESRR